MMAALLDRVRGEGWESPFHVVGRQLAEALCRRPLGAGFLFLTGHVPAPLNLGASLGRQFAGLGKCDIRIMAYGQFARLAAEA